MASVIIHRNAGESRTAPLTPPVVTIGKSAENHIVLDHPGISRRHCEIHILSGKTFVRDIESRNGTYVNGVRVVADLPLRHGEIIQLGEFTLTYLEDSIPIRAESAPAAVPSAAPISPPPAAPAGPDAGALELRKLLHRDLLESMDLKRLDISKLSADAMRRKTRETVSNLVERHAHAIPPGISKDRIIKEIVDEALGLGPLEDLLADPDINEIMVNRFDRIYIERKGKIQLSGKQFTDNRQVVEVIRRIIAPIGRRIDESSPMVDARLADGSRVNAIIAPLALSGPTLTIRKFSKDPYTIRDLIKFGTLTDPMADFLRLCVTYRKNMCISGGTGSGKTTLLNVLTSFIPNDERIVTIEDAAELRLSQEHVVSLESKPPNIEGEGAIPIRKLVMNSLRMRPDRIVVGECRGGEALDMLQAMNTGHDGSLTTLHANSCRDAIARLETMVLMAGMDLPAKAIRDQIASAMDLMVHTARLTDGTRKITKIAAVGGMEGDIITLQDIFEFKQSGYDGSGKIIGKYEATGSIPSFIHELRQRGIEINMGIFRT